MLSEETGISHIPCAAHILNLIIKKVLNNKPGNNEKGDSESDNENATRTTQSRGRKPELIGLVDSEKKAALTFVAQQEKLKKLVTKFHQSSNLNHVLTEHQKNK